MGYAAGMPRDSEATKARIFDAAVAEFAASGIAGARVDRIAKAARANKQLIYAYFGSKHKLFATVLERILADLAAAAPIDGDDLPGCVDVLFAYHRAHPHVMRLLLWEALENGDRSVASEPERTAHYQDKITQVRRAQNDGVVTGDLSAPVLTLALLSIVSWPIAVPQLPRMLLGETTDDSRQIQQELQEVARRLTQPGRG
jgi:AcrR family transcriptional regulator